MSGVMGVLSYGIGTANYGIRDVANVNDPKTKQKFRQSVVQTVT